VVKIELPRIPLDFDKAEIRPDAAIALGPRRPVAQRGQRAVKIDCHTDPRAHRYNLKLSQDRANRSRRGSSRNGGLPANLAYTLTGYGATRPAAANTNPEARTTHSNRQLNRRVEITFTTK